MSDSVRPRWHWSRDYKLYRRYSLGDTESMDPGEMELYVIGIENHAFDLEGQVGALREKAGLADEYARAIEGMYPEDRTIGQQAFLNRYNVITSAEMPA